MAQTSPASERLDKVTIITGVAKASARAAPASSCAPGRPWLSAPGTRPPAWRPPRTSRARGQGPAASSSATSPGRRDPERHRPHGRAVWAAGLPDQQRGLAPGPPDYRRLLREEFEDLLRLNLVSYFAAAKYALPHLLRRGQHHNMSASWAHRAGVGGHLRLHQGRHHGHDQSARCGRGAGTGCA